MGLRIHFLQIGLGLKMGICLATLCFTAEVRADSPKISLGASVLIVASGSVTDDVISPGVWCATAMPCAAAHKHSCTFSVRESVSPCARGAWCARAAPPCRTPPRGAAAAARSCPSRATTTTSCGSSTRCASRCVRAHARARPAGEARRGGRPARTHARLAARRLAPADARASVAAGA